MIEAGRIAGCAADSAQPVLLPLAVEGARVDAEDLRRRLEARGAGEDAADVLELEPLEADRPAQLDRRVVDVARPGNPLGQVGRADLGAGGEDGGALDGVAQLAEVAGPGVA